MMIQCYFLEQCSGAYQNDICTIYCCDQTGLPAFVVLLWIDILHFLVGNSKVFISKDNTILTYDKEYGDLISTTELSGLKPFRKIEATQNGSSFLLMKEEKEIRLVCFSNEKWITAKLPDYNYRIPDYVPKHIFNVIGNYCLIGSHQGKKFTVYDTQLNTWEFDGSLNNDRYNNLNCCIANDHIYYYSLDNHLVCYSLLDKKVIYLIPVVNTLQFAVFEDKVITKGNQLSCYKMGTLLWEDNTDFHYDLICHDNELYTCSNKMVQKYDLETGNSGISQIFVNSYDKRIVGFFEGTVVVQLTR